ncbi:MAG: SpoIIE family protein phosphatase [Deltaproteobacteria bacterium]|nr:SpoIIE family protein phosphatase [Deltaproteobacteria bacterium]
MTESSQHTLLIVDDEGSILKLLEYTFKPDYRVLTALSGAEGLEILRKEKVSLIIADQRMPEMTGSEFLEKSIAINPDAIRMVLTGYTDIDSAIQAINSGRVYRYLTKPWEDEDLRLNVRRALETYDLQQTNRRLLDELKEANERLEEKVKLRTAELEEANAQLREAQKQMEQDLALAERIQRTLVPGAVRRPDLEIETVYRPMIGIGGDYALTRLEEDRVFLAVCDVTGHGIAASGVANRVHMELGRLVGEGASPAETLTAMNRFVYQQFAELGMYMTMAVAELEIASGRLLWASAGHPPSLLWRSKDGAGERLDVSAPVLGVEPELRGGAEQGESLLSPGDRLILYTDGLTEARDAHGQFFGVDRLEKLLAENAGRPVDEMSIAIVDGVDGFRFGPARDDIVLLAVARPERN